MYLEDRGRLVCGFSMESIDIPEAYIKHPHPSRSQDTSPGPRRSKRLKKICKMGLKVAYAPMPISDNDDSPTFFFGRGLRPIFRPIFWTAENVPPSSSIKVSQRGHFSVFFLRSEGRNNAGHVQDPQGSHGGPWKKRAKTWRVGIWKWKTPIRYDKQCYLLAENMMSCRFWGWEFSDPVDGVHLLGSLGFFSACLDESPIWTSMKARILAGKIQFFVINKHIIQRCAKPSTEHHGFFIF